MTMVPRDDHDQAGFTLLELLVVLAILATITASAMTMTSHATTALDMRAAGNALAAELRLTRARAILRNEDALLTVDVDAHEFWADPPALRHELGRAIKVELITAAPERLNASAGRFRYFPDGSSTGGTITLSEGPRTVTVAIDWLTGIPTVTSE